MYRFDHPGLYEVRYVEHSGAVGSAPIVVSPWTTIEVSSATPADRARWLAETSAHAPSDAKSLLTEYLPDILGNPDQESLELLVRYLNHPDALVRRYVSYGLSYWPGDQATQAVLAKMNEFGPTEDSARLLSVARDLTASQAEFASAIALKYLDTDTSANLVGAMNTLMWVALAEKLQVSSNLRIRVERALVDARTHITALSDQDAAAAYAEALGRTRSDRVSEILWSLVDHRLAREQALYVIAGRGLPSDLARLTEISTGKGSKPGDTAPVALPNVMHHAYGAIALPFIEKMLQSDFPRIRVESARELVLAGRASGFAFIAVAAEQNQPSRRDLLQFLRDQFPEIRTANDASVVVFAKTRAHVIQ